MKTDVYLPISLLLLILPFSIASDNNSTYTIPSAHNFEPQTTSPAQQFTFNETNECHDIVNLHSSDQCQFALEYCDDYKIGFINYVSFYYCQSSKLITLFSYVFMLVILFTTLGLTASDFLCPNLDTISKFFRMSESLSGVTLLALGNGSPDLFSTFEAMKIDAASLAIGELIGAALFITCVVVGSMAIVKPFKVAKRPFIRDIFFLIISLSLVTYFLSDGVLSEIEALFMILLYLVYVLFVVFWDFITTKRRKTELINRKIRNRFIDESSRSTDLAAFEIQENNEVNDDDINESLNFAADGGIEVLDRQLDQESNRTFDEWTRSSTYNTIRPSILGALDFNARMNEIKSNNKSNPSIDQISLRTLSTLPSTNTSATIRMSSAPVFRDNVDDDDEPLLTPGEYEERITHSAPGDLEEFSMYRDDSGTFIDQEGPDFIEAHNLVKDQVKSFMERTNIIGKSSNFYFTLFPTLRDFKSKSIFEKAFGIICLPLITVLRLTVPVIETEHKSIVLDTTWRKSFILLLLQCLISPLITYILISYDDGLSLKFFIIPFIVTLFLIPSIYLIRSAYKKDNKSLPQVGSIILAGSGFIISICWISTIATELISIIKFFSLFFGLSDAILGVTVFAIGNSLGDFISNFTIAKMGFPMMALSACFGGPLLNILLGIGGSGLYIIPTTGSNINVHISKTLIVSGFTLFVNLLLLLLVVPFNNWKMDKIIGWSMIALWSVATTVCVIFEILS